jgi:tetratricopeptide (TPR) repeat protein
MEANLLTKAKWAGRTRDAYLKAVELDPAYVEAHYELMQYYLLAPGFLGGGRDKADTTAATIATLDLVWGKLAASSIALQDEKPELAERLLREAVEQAPDNERGYQALSATLQRQKRWSEAKSLWQTLLQNQPDNSLAHYSIARNAVLADEGYEEGLQHIDRFIELGVLPENYTMGAAHWRRGLLLEKLDRTQEAIASLQLAAADPQTRELAQPDLARLTKLDRS